mgnify:CR=1 FL=1
MLVDPFEGEKGTRAVRWDGGDVVALSRPAAVPERKGSSRSDASLPPRANTAFVIAGPGEYDFKNFFVQSWLGPAQDLIYLIETEGVKLCHWPSALDKELNEDQLARVGEVDVLMVAVGDDADANEAAAKLVNQIEPRLVVPMGFDPAKKPATFLKEMGASGVEPQNKLSLKKKDLPLEEIEVVLLGNSK